MSKFGKNGIQAAMEASSKIAVDRFMEQQSSENIKMLRASLNVEGTEKEVHV